MINLQKIKTRRKYWPIILGVLPVLFIGIFFLVKTYGSDLAGTILKNLISEQSKGRYELDFSEINVSFVEKQILIIDLELIKSQHLNTDTSSQLYTISIPKLELTIGSILSIYLGKEIEIKGISIHDPEISISSSKSRQKSSFSFEAGSLYNSISEYINAFSVNDLAIENASVEFSKSDLKNPLEVLVNQIDFTIDNFLVDSTASADTSKFLYTDKIELIISNQNFSLPDSIHYISFDEFHISTGTGDILFKNLELLPREEIDLSTINSFYEIQIPEFNFRGLDFSRAYLENELHLDSLRILNPIVKVQTKKNNSPKGKNLDLLDLSTRLFEKFEIKKLYVDDASIDIITDHKHSYTGQEVNLEIEKIKIDSSKIASKSWTELIENIRVEGNNFETFLMDSTHLLQAGRFMYSSFESEVGLYDLLIKPLDYKEDRIQAWIQLKAIESSGLASLSDLSRGHLSTKDLSILNPDLKISLPRQESNEKSREKSFVKELTIGNFSLINSSLLLESQDSNLEIDKLDVNLRRVAFKPSSMEEFVFNEFAKKSKVELRSLSLESKKMNLELKKLNLSNWKDLTASDISLKPNTSTTPFTFEKIKVTEFDLDHFLNNKLLAFDSLIVDRPVLKFHSQQDRKKDNVDIIKWAHHTTFKEVHLRNGSLTQYKDEDVQVHLENFDVELSKFHFDSLKNEYYTLVGYQSDSVYLHLENFNHEITGKDLSISIKDSTLQIKRLSMVPLSQDANTRISVSTHELKLRRIDFHKLINDQKLHFHGGHILSPKADVFLRKEKRAEKRTANDILKFNSLNVSNGYLHFENHIRDSSLMINVQKLNMLINGFDLGQDSSIFFAKNYLGDLRGITLRRFGSKDSISVEKAFINTKSGSIDVSNINMNPDENSHLFLPKIQITGFNPETLASENIIDLDSIKIEEPFFEITLNSQGKASQKKQTRIPTFNASNIFIRNGNMKLLNPDINFGDTINFKSIDFSVNNLSLDSSSTLLTISENLKNCQFSMDDFFITTPDSLYQLKTSKVGYSGTENKILLESVELNPIYSKDAFQSQITYQKDWLSMTIDSIQLKGINIRKLLTDDYLEFNSVVLSKLHLDTHKDKRLPLPPENEKPLPQELISKVPIRFYVKNIGIDSAYISHSEFSPTGTLPGLIFFQNMNAEISNISNDHERLEENRVMTLHTTGTMMNTGQYEVDVDFDLMDTTQFFYFEGELNGMDLRELNELLENTAFVQIKDGFNRRVTFQFEANHDYAIGDMKFYYNDLKIRVLKPNDEAHKRHAASIKSFFANTFVVNKKNPHFLFVRQGDIFHHRDLNKAIFNYWSKALLSGVVSSIGAKNNKKEIKKLNEELKAQLDQKRRETLERVKAHSSNSD
ncbi:MAG: hypothetical protein JXR03_02835 [Cyclobacteriaceae bacterium]